MGPIRPHKKSRTGCKTCRGRRVKCDEVHPICSNCARRELTCVYDPPPRIEVQSLLSTPTPPPKPESPSYAFLNLFSIPPSPHPVFSHLDLTRLELFHQYSTETYRSFSNHEPWLPVWRDAVPKLCIEYPFVLYATLAISALHLSVKHSAKDPRRSQHYQVLATSYYNEASFALREALPRRQSLEPNALFVTSSFIAIYVFACPAVAERHGSPRALTWLPVLRGIPALVSGNWDNITDGLAPPLRHAPQHAPSESRSSLPPLPPLHQLTDGVEDEADKIAYTDAIKALEMAYSMHQRVSEQFWVAAAFVWPVKIPEGFIKLLIRHEPRALVLLAHYGAMFSKLQGFWWIGSRAREELEIIERIVGEDWTKVWLGWASKDWTGVGS
ncbi:Similar to Sterol regulatory element-binding protein ECM22; acc. no. Q05958 [Pyronema omphalodes CBS 100304]|uniref:Similar to Sterol regulatory element-binding protein ECM22 acc. no. Q05958 n=1 Tax=Pyronema omphalodes (strain CBS 100304) TaxID=1076935 RepID=U4LN32_PYROM|nr:Similar to Sterol regulatory element-binding protein ECM22; acc. no. Q05958 [Pyronema omphalodes CBS 100304]